MSSMIIRFIRSVLTAVFAIGAVAAPAQLAPGLSGFSSVREAEMDEFFWALDELGACLVSSKTEQSLAFLRSGVGTAAEGAALKLLLGRHNNSCLRHLTSMHVERRTLRGAVAEAMYETVASSPPAALPYPSPGKLSVEGLQALGYDGLIESFSSCWVARNPDLVHELITSSKLGSKAERQAVEKMRPGFSVCLPEKIRLELDPAELRLALAEAAFRRLSLSGSR